MDAMDPLQLITGLPPEWLPLFIIIALLYKGWQLWILRDVKPKDDDDVTPAVG